MFNQLHNQKVRHLNQPSVFTWMTDLQARACAAGDFLLAKALGIDYDTYMSVTDADWPAT